MSKNYQKLNEIVDYWKSSILSRDNVVCIESQHGGRALLFRAMPININDDNAKAYVGIEMEPGLCLGLWNEKNGFMKDVWSVEGDTRNKRNAEQWKNESALKRNFSPKSTN